MEGGIASSLEAPRNDAIGTNETPDYYLGGDRPEDEKLTKNLGGNCCDKNGKPLPENSENNRENCQC